MDDVIKAVLVIVLYTLKVSVGYAFATVIAVTVARAMGVPI